MYMEDKIQHFGAIVTISLQCSPNLLLSCDGYSSNRLTISRYNNGDTNLITRAQFMVVPTFTNYYKTHANKYAQELLKLEFHEIEKGFQDLEQKLYFEYKTNSDDFERMKESKVKFEDSVQLLHINSNKFLGVKVPKIQDGNGMIQETFEFDLCSVASESTIFQFDHAYRYQSVGERYVYYGAPVHLAFQTKFEENWALFNT